MRFAFQAEGKNCDGDFDESEIFATMSSNEAETVKISPVRLEEEQRLNRRENLNSLKSFNERLPRKFCCAQWSISRRCLDCAWISQRGGRPAHPLPPLYSSDNSSPLVTLKSLGKRDDSGYEPSPTSMFSFSFPSDDEDANTEVFSDKDPESPSNVYSRKFIPVEKEREADKNTEIDEIDGSPQLKRSKSLPELWSSEKFLSRTPIMVRNDFLKTPSRTPVHGRNCSLPATTSDGKPLFVTPSNNQSQEGLIDLTKYKGRSTGHNRRVLVLALPDILVDLNGRFPSKCKTPLDYRSTNASESLKKRPELYSSSSSPSSCSSELYDSISTRPTWKRPRALSCDVTLEVEFGQELRKIADDFSKKSLSREGSVWGALRRGFERRFSLGENNRIGEILEEERVSHSLPSSPAYNWL